MSGSSRTLRRCTGVTICRLNFYRTVRVYKPIIFLECCFIDCVCQFQILVPMKMKLRAFMKRWRGNVNVLHEHQNLYYIFIWIWNEYVYMFINHYYYYYSVLQFFLVLLRFQDFFSSEIYILKQSIQTLHRYTKIHLNIRSFRNKI